MDVRLGLRRIVDRYRRGSGYDIEEERYDDLRDTAGMIDLDDYVDVSLRQREAVAYIDLTASALERDADGLVDFDLDDLEAEAS